MAADQLRIILHLNDICGKDLRVTPKDEDGEPYLPIK